MSRDLCVVITVPDGWGGCCKHLFWTYEEADVFCSRLREQGHPYHDSRPVLSAEEAKRWKALCEESRGKMFSDSDGRRPRK